MDHIIEIERHYNGNLTVYIDNHKPLHLFALDSLDANAVQTIKDEDGQVYDEQKVRVIVNPL